MEENSIEALYIQRLFNTAFHFQEDSARVDVVDEKVGHFRNSQGFETFSENPGDMTSYEKEKLNPEWNSDTFNVVRPVYVQEDLDKKADYQKRAAKTIPQQWGVAVRVCGFGACIKNFLPILTWLPQYSIKRDLLGDFISGCTVAIMHIPQGMAYAMLSGVPPVVGLYMAFFPVLAYFFLGTSRHVSMGTFAVACLMTGKAVETYATVDASGVPLHEIHNSTDTIGGLDFIGPHITPIEVATAVCFLVGIYQTGMWVFRLGVVATLLSEALVSGFITGATMHVMVSQLKDLFGISVFRYKGNFKVPLTLIAVARNIPNLNWAAFVTSFIGIVVMSLNNELLKPWVSKRSKIPIPIELIAVIAGTLINKYGDLHNNYGVKLVGEIPTGLPVPSIPRLDLLSEVAIDSFTITMVSYTITMSMALIFAAKSKYEIEPNQELLAMGAGNIFGSFFSCVPFCASLSRSLIQFQAGGKSQIASVVSCCLLLCVLLWIGPFFEDLPRAVLASIIVVALKGMLMQAKDIVRFWKLSRIDAAVWISTCLVTIFVNIDIGLLVGIVASVGTLFIRAQCPYTCLLGKVANTDLYLDIKRYKAALEIPGIKIFHYCGGLNFASKNVFRSTLYRKCGLSVHSPKKSVLENGLLKTTNSKDLSSFEFSQTDNKQVRYLLLDLTATCYVDAGGVTMLRSIFHDLDRQGIQLLLARANGPVLEMMDRFDRLETDKIHFTTFPTVHDAVLFAMAHMQTPVPAITTS